MIVTEFYRKRRDGVRLVRTYSDANFYIEREGVRYEEAIDPEDAGRVYTETDIPIPMPEPEPESGDGESDDEGGDA